MKNTNIIPFLKHIASLLLIYSICRGLFLVFNYSYFSDLGITEAIPLFFFGIKFDFSVIILCNLLFIVAYLLPIPYIQKKTFYKKSVKILFISVNSIAILMNLIDLAYFQFTLKRTTADILNFFNGSIGNDLTVLLPTFIVDYWYVPTLWLLLSILLIQQYNKVENQNTIQPFSIFRQFITFIIVIGLSIIIYRGGFQLKPMGITTANAYASAKYAPLVLNTTFSILKTSDTKGIERQIYFTDKQELKKYYNTTHKADTSRFKKLNVMLIILESFSKEHIGALNPSATCTPFLDSLIKNSLSCTNAFANGKTSITGIPSIVSGIPSWMPEPYITSRYGNNPMNSIASLLRKEGYQTSFFHGGTNGTMGFDAFANIAGYDHYYGKNEYNNEADFDGHWGIWDEEFLQYTAHTMNKTKEPFVSTVFTLSSHHPYSIPKRYANSFNKQDSPLENCISYTDYALQQFFETAKEMPWFNNTLFVLCADHTGVSDDLFFSNAVGKLAIPIVYYLANSDLKAEHKRITQQIDILPSVLDYLNYPSEYSSFGNSIFDSTCAPFNLFYNNGIYHYFTDSTTLQFDGKRFINLYNYRKDSLLNNDIHIENEQQAKEIEIKTKAIIQTYQEVMTKGKF